jgi:hypothetical protein
LQRFAKKSDLSNCKKLGGIKLFYRQQSFPQNPLDQNDGGSGEIARKEIMDDLYATLEPLELEWLIFAHH